MDILKLLEKDHEEVETLLVQIQKNAHGKGKRKELLDHLKQELQAHNQAEEAIVYKEIEKKGNDLLVNKSQEEHKIAEQYMETLKEDLTEALFRAKAEVLTNLITTHIDEEEEEIFTKLKEEFSQEDLKKLGQRFQEEKDKITQL